MNRLTRQEAAEFIGCSISQLYRIEREKLLDGTFYELGTGKRRKRLYITAKLEEWANKGGVPAAYERKLGITL